MWLQYFLCLLVLGTPTFGQSDCSIKITQTKGKYKIYLNGFHWLKPRDSFNGTKATISHGEVVQMSCENGFITDDFVGNTYTFECTDGKFNKTLLYEDLLCKSDYQKKTKTFVVPSRQLGSRILKCEGKRLEVYQVKVEREDGNLKHLYTVCFDKNVMRPKFVFQPRRIIEEPVNVKRQDKVWGFDRFGKTVYEKLKLTNGYVTKIQKNRLTRVFSQKYRNKKYPYNFNRGHLAPHGDFNLKDDKKASCEYINVAPQWKEFNANSWSLVEIETRDLVKNNSMEWEIYTGTYGNIPTEKGPLFISPFFDRDGKFIKAFIPVPALYWKIVYNTAYQNLSRVFVGVNNPELKSPEEFTKLYLVCNPKTGRGKKPFKGNEFKGFTYECDLQEFLEKLHRDEKTVIVSNNPTETKIENNPKIS